jgi:Thioesterase-like superfamily
MCPDQLPSEARALFVPDGDRFVPTPLSGGPWSPENQFGGSAAALLATAIEDIPTLVPQQVVRLTVDLMRPVPVRPITVESRVVREGKRIQVTEAAIIFDGREVARCSALRMRIGDLGDLPVDQGEPQIGPPTGASRPEGPYDKGNPPGVAGATHFTFESPDGFFVDPTWIRMRVPVIAGRETRPLARLAFFADFASGIGHPRSLPVTGINADLTLNVVRYPTDEWLCLTGTGWTSPRGIGLSQAAISDSQGVSASVSLSRLVDRTRPPSSAVIPKGKRFEGKQPEHRAVDTAESPA